MSTSASYRSCFFSASWSAVAYCLLFLFTSFSKSFFIVLFSTYSVNVNFRDYLYMLTIWILYFRAVMGLPHTHALCMTHSTQDRRGTLCKNPGSVLNTNCPSPWDIRGAKYCRKVLPSEQGAWTLQSTDSDDRQTTTRAIMRTLCFLHIQGRERT